MKPAPKTIHTIENPSAYITAVIISMLYMSLMLGSAVLTNRYVGSNSFFVLGGTLISPLFFIMDDIVAEIYGYKITQFMICAGFAAQTVFALVCLAVVNAPHPAFFNQQSAYSYILGSSLLMIDISGFIAYIIANLVNSYILTRWKVLLKGRKFWLRSLGSSTFSEFLYTFIAIGLMEMRRVPLHNVLQLILISFSIKITYSLVFAGPATVFVNFIKRKTGIDVYDFSKNFTPKWFYEKQRSQMELNHD